MFAGQPVTDYRTYKNGDAARQRAFIDALTLLGVRPTGRGTWFVSCAHSQVEVKQTLAAVERALAALV